MSDFMEGAAGFVLFLVIAINVLAAVIFGTAIVWIHIMRALT